MASQHCSELTADYEIRNLLIRERYYRDTCQWAKLRDSYHPDASKTSINITWFHGDVEGFVSGSEKMTRGGAGAIHSICPVEIITKGDRAVAESAGSIAIRFVYQDIEFDCISYTRFMSRLERVEGEWKLLTLEAVYDKDSIVPVKPEGSQTIIPVDSNARPSYKCIAWVLGQHGFIIDQQLPGSDIVGSEEKLRRTNLSWL